MGAAILAPLQPAVVPATAPSCTPNAPTLLPGPSSSAPCHPQERATLRSNKGRREALAVATVAFGLSASARRAHARCKNLDECRELGDARFEESERQKGPITRLGGGVKFRELQVGTGPALGPGGEAEITYEVRRANGDYLYSLGRGRRDLASDDFGDTYRVRLGKRDVPVAVEKAMEGMKAGSIRVVEFPERFGFKTSDWRPLPTNYSGQQRMQGYRKKQESYEQNKQIVQGVDNGPVLKVDQARPKMSYLIQFEVQVVRVRRAEVEQEQPVSGA